VFLESLGASVGLDPTRFFGTIGLSVVRIVSITGDLFMVFASNDEPYTFTGNELALGAGLTLPTPTATDFAFAVGGDVGVTIPVVGTQTLAGGYVMYIFPDYVAAGGNIHFDPFNGWLVFDASIAGQFAVGSGNFNLEATAEIHALKVFDLKGDAVLSNVGIGGCGTISVLGIKESLGAGYKWGDSIPGGINISIGSCDVSPYRVKVQAARAAVAGYTVRIPAGLPSEMIRLPGDGGAPDVTITGPGGVRASNSGSSPVISGPFVIYPVPVENTTYIGILKPPGGRYRITANPGSFAITQLLQADGVSPSVRAHVAVRRGRFVLVYRVRRAVGQEVTFFEQAGQVYRAIGSSSARSGRIAFTPGPGPAGTRQIVAEITENGTPVVLHPGATGSAAYEMVLASYRAPGPRMLPRVAHVRVRRPGTRVLVAWRAVRSAARYAVTVTLSSGVHVVYMTRRPSLTIPGVFGEINGRLAIQAIGDGITTRDGPTVNATIPRKRP
jgi:hypothetical protein